MQTWLERARATAPKRAIKRGSSNLPTLENLGAYGNFLRGLLAEDESMGRRRLREAIKGKGFLVSQQTMRTWLKRHEGKCRKAIRKAPKEGLPCLDVAGLRGHEAWLLRYWNSEPSITYTGLKEALEQSLAMTCTKEAMRTFMQTPSKSMKAVDFDTLRQDEYVGF